MNHMLLGRGAPHDRPTRAAPLRTWPLILSFILCAAGCRQGYSTGSTRGAVHTVCGGASTVPGIDVSQWQATVDWAKVKAAGKVFAFARVTHGLNEVDTQFAANWPAMKKAGLIRGPYQYFLPGQGGLEQAKLFVSKLQAAGGLDAADLPPVLDLEATDNLSAAQILAAADAWVAHVEATLHRHPLLYTGPYFWDDHKLGTSYAARPLWTANYNVTCPLIPDAWKAWTFWQTSSKGAVAGITGNVDLDVYNGTAAQLSAFIAASKIPVLDGGGGKDLARGDGPAPVDGARDLRPADSAPREGGAGAEVGLERASAPPEGGCCSVAGTPPAWSALVTLLLLGVWRRTRRTH